MGLVITEKHQWETPNMPINPRAFARLSLDGVHIEKTTNPVILMLLSEKNGKATDKNATIRPEDEWLIFPD